MPDLATVLLLTCAGLVLIPPRYDPAIRIKMAQESAIKRQKSDQRRS